MTKLHISSVLIFIQEKRGKGSVKPYELRLREKVQEKLSMNYFHVSHQNALVVTTKYTIVTILVTEGGIMLLLFNRLNVQWRNHLSLYVGDVGSGRPGPGPSRTTDVMARASLEPQTSNMDPIL